MRGRRWTIVRHPCIRRIGKHGGNKPERVAAVEDSARNHVPDQLEQLLVGLAADGGVVIRVQVNAVGSSSQNSWSADAIEMLKTANTA